MKLIDTKALATDVISHDVTPLTVNTDAKAYSRLGWLIVVFGVFGFLIWACVAPLDKGVPMSGNVASLGNRKAIQYLSGGMVDQILVKDGDLVKKGQVLVKMNGVQVSSQAEVTKAQLITALTAQARLKAERDGAIRLTFPTELDQFKGDAHLADSISLQTQLFASRQSGLQNELSGLTESIEGLKSQLTGLTSARDSKVSQLAIVNEQVENLRDLARDGYVSRSKLLDQERAFVQIKGAIAEDNGNIGRAQRQIAELTVKKAQRRADYQKEVGAQLADVERDASSLSRRLVAESFAVNNIDVKSPVDGYVMGMAVFTRGGVVQPGFRMMDVVPEDDALIVEGRLPVNLVDKVHAGLPTELIFSAFNTNTTPHIPGVIKFVSADRLLDEHNGMPYYNVQAQVNPEGLKMLRAKKMDVRPGMPVELFVKTGERTMMSYLLKPLFDRAKTSMTED